MQNIKRGISSLFVCILAIFPLFSIAQWSGVFDSVTVHDSRQATPLPAFVEREQDKYGSVNPFREPIVSITFDDGWESVYTVAAPLLQEYGIHSTQYLLSGSLSKPGYLSEKQIINLYNAGQHIGCHSVNHYDLTTLSDIDLKNELQSCKDFYEALLDTEVKDFASPYGHTNDNVIKAISQIYRSQRNTNGDITNGLQDADINTVPRFKQYDIISYAVRNDTTTEQIQQAIQYAITYNAWLIFTYHEADNENTFGLNADNLRKQFDTISRSPVRIASVNTVMDTLLSEVKVEY